MRYKLPIPEDYPEVKDYSFQLSNAYARTYSDFLTLLVYVDTAIDNLDNADASDVEAVREFLKKQTDKYKID